MIMQDSFGRTIQYLRLSVTDLCNYRCIYCMPEEGVCKKSHADMLSIEEMTEIVRAAHQLGISKVRLTGGEPLVRKGIISLCRNIKAIDSGIELGITTNGAYLSTMASELKDAGVDRLNISLDSMHPESVVPVPMRDHREFRARKSFAVKGFVEVRHMGRGMPRVHSDRHLAAADVAQIGSVFGRIKCIDPDVFTYLLKTLCHCSLLLRAVIPSLSWSHRQAC